MNALEKVKRPVWLEEMDKLVSDTSKRVAILHEKLNDIYFGKGPRPELKPPGAPPTFEKSFWGKEMEAHYKEQIDETKKFTYDHCSKMLEHVDVNERAKFADEIKKKLEITRPDSLQPQNKEEQKGLDASQDFMKGLSDKFASNDNTHPVHSAKQQNKADIFQSMDIDKE